MWVGWWVVDDASEGRHVHRCFEQETDQKGFGPIPPPPEKDTCSPLTYLGDVQVREGLHDPRRQHLGRVPVALLTLSTLLTW